MQIVQIVSNWHTFNAFIFKAFGPFSHEEMYSSDRRKLRRRLNLKKDAKLISYCLSVRSAIAWIEIVQDFPEIL